MLYVIIQVIIISIEKYYKDRCMSHPVEVNKLIQSLSYAANKDWHMIHQDFFKLGEIKTCSDSSLFILMIIMNMCDKSKERDIQFVGRFLFTNHSNITRAIEHAFTLNLEAVNV